MLHALKVVRNYYTFCKMYTCKKICFLFYIIWSNLQSSVTFYRRFNFHRNLIYILCIYFIWKNNLFPQIERVQSWFNLKQELSQNLLNLHLFYEIYKAIVGNSHIEFFNNPIPFSTSTFIHSYKIFATEIHTHRHIHTCLTESRLIHT